MMFSPRVTCPSAAITTVWLRRTHNTVVERIFTAVSVGFPDGLRLMRTILNYTPLRITKGQRRDLQRHLPSASSAHVEPEAARGTIQHPPKMEVVMVRKAGMISALLIGFFV